VTFHKHGKDAPSELCLPVFGEAPYPLPKLDFSKDSSVVIYDWGPSLRRIRAWNWRNCSWYWKRLTCMRIAACWGVLL
jgi:hypothetical protein